MKRKIKYSKHTCQEMINYQILINNLVDLLPLLGSFAPMRIVHGGIFEQSGKDKNETSDQIDVDSLDIANARQRRAHACANRGHSEHCGDAESDARRRRLVIDPKRHP